MCILLVNTCNLGYHYIFLINGIIWSYWKQCNSNILIQTRSLISRSKCRSFTNAWTGLGLYHIPPLCRVEGRKSDVTYIAQNIYILVLPALHTTNQSCGNIPRWRVEIEIPVSSSSTTILSTHRHQLDQVQCPARSPDITFHRTPCHQGFICSMDFWILFSNERNKKFKPGVHNLFLTPNWQKSSPISLSGTFH